MKVLHIGKSGNMERFSAPGSYLTQLEVADMYMNQPSQIYLDAAGDAEFIIVDAMGDLPGDLIRRMPGLRLIHSEGVAYNRIDLAAADECGVYVCNSKGMNAMAVAEQAVLLMVGMLRNVAVNDGAVRQARQIETKEGYMLAGNLYELADYSIGLVGFGDIARCTARLLQAYGVTRIYYNKRHRLPTEEEQALGVRYLPLDDLLAQSGIVSLHLPVTPETAGIVNAEFLSRMPQGSYLVNTARGELVDDAALAAALESGRLTMAGLDTLDHEPVQPDHPLLHLPEDISRRILFSPHIGGITMSSFRRSYAMIWEDIQDVAEGRIPQRVVNHPVIGTDR